MISEFAQRQMKLAGWEEGKGIGRNEDGMAEAIKVSMKADKTGVGHDPGEQFTFHWWEHVFEKSAKNIKVKEHDDGVTLSTTSETMTASTKKRSDKLLSKQMLYGCFVRSGILENGQVKEDSSSSEDSDLEKNKNQILTDEQLFTACGGRTAHKGARHGVNLSGKLARLQEQEEGTVVNSTSTKKRKKKKKIRVLDDVKVEKTKKKKKRKLCKEDEVSGEEIKKKKKRKKRLKRCDS